MKITVIGAGNMGGALVKGWTKAGMAADITASAHTQQTLDRLVEACPGITVTLDNRKAAEGADVVVLAVKPWLVQQVISEIMPELRKGPEAETRPEQYTEIRTIQEPDRIRKTTLRKKDRIIS